MTQTIQFEIVPNTKAAAVMFGRNGTVMINGRVFRYFQGKWQEWVGETWL